jgi:hypothetical protein
MAIKSADQITIVDITDAYSVMLTSESYTFMGGTDGVASGNSCTTQAVAYCGSTQCQKVKIGTITCPTGLSSSVSNNETAAPTITLRTTATLSAACEVIIPVEVDGIVVNKKFSIAVAKTGSSGTNGTSVKISEQKVEYQAHSNGTTAPTGTWSTTIPNVTNGQYLWTKTTVNYSDGTKTESYSVSYKGINGTNGNDGTSVSVSSTSVTYQVGTSGTTKPTGTWVTSVPTVGNGKFLWTKTIVTYSDGKSTESYSVSYAGTNGKDGENGADAITMTITTSNGSVFKNSSGSTVLTAHVFVGGIEQTITDAGVCGDLGTVKWYKDSGTTAVATAKTLTVSASDVTNSVVYTAQLE